MKTSCPHPLTLVNTGLLLLLIYLTLGNREVGKGNAARLDSQRALSLIEATYQRQQITQIMQSTVARWEHLYGDNPQLKPREVRVGDMQVPTPTPAPR